MMKMIIAREKLYPLPLPRPLPYQNILDKLYSSILSLPPYENWSKHNDNDGHIEREIILINITITTTIVY